MTTAQGPGPLAGITVIDLTRVLAGPYCTMMLAAMGARVIKVERPGTGDDSRAIGPFVNDVSAYFVSLNRGKESIALDLKDDGDRDVFDALLARADVLIENYRPGTMERLGYGCRRWFPSLWLIERSEALALGSVAPIDIRRPSSQLGNQEFAQLADRDACRRLLLERLDPIQSIHRPIVSTARPGGTASFNSRNGGTSE